MVTKLSFENRTTEILNVIIEPEAANFDLAPGKSLEIEVNYEHEQSNEKLETVLEDGRLIIYQNTCTMKIYVDSELQF